MNATKEPLEASANKLNAIGEVLNRMFPKDVSFVLMVSRNYETLVTSNLCYDDVCEVLQEFINSIPTEIREN